MKRSSLLLVLSFALVACGTQKAQTAAATRSQGTLVSGAGLSIGSCRAMSQSNMSSAEQISDQQALTGFTACATSDPSTVELVYNNYMFNGPTSFCAVSGDNSQVSCFQISSASATAFPKFPSAASSVYVVLQKDVDTFGPGTTAIYDYASVR
jgi:hypothetical protein